MNKKGRRATSSSEGTNSSGSLVSVRRALISEMCGSGKNTNVISSDITWKRQNMNIVQIPPRNVGQLTHWEKSSVTGTFSVGAGSSSETNFQFAITDVANYSSWLAAFDQFCIFAVVLEFMTYSTTPVLLLTAIDYDNSANVGIAGLNQFASLATTDLGGSVTHVRYVEPCLDPITYASNYGSSRLWIDSASSGALWYGVRTFVNNPGGQAIVVQWTKTYVVGLRNGI